MTTEFSLVQKSGATVTFAPAGATVKVTTRWVGGDKVVATVSVGLARKMWAQQVKAGAKKVEAATTGPTMLEGGHLVLDCLDPESHDGEECNCAERLAAERAEHEKEFRTPPPGTFAYAAWMMAKSGMMTGDEADAWKDRMKDESMGL